MHQVLIVFNWSVTALKIFFACKANTDKQAQAPIIDSCNIAPVLVVIATGRGEGWKTWALISWQWWHPVLQHKPIIQVLEL